jgi:CheY-like chemotaxis protein
MNASSPKTILFVEDDLVVLTAYRNKLEREGFSVVTAADGVEAMKHLMLSVPDVVILDLMLPKVNGVDVMKFIRKTERLQKVPVIVLSTNSIIDGKSDTILETAQRRLIKDTCTPATILAAIQHVLQPAPGPSLEDFFSAVSF